MEKSKNSDENQGSQVSIDKKRPKCVEVNENNSFRDVKKWENTTFLMGFGRFFADFLPIFHLVSSY